ncbi:hemolysin XhlA family protein [Cupriavidus metallidurans]|uniref:hemolysin XhlA family protein n=1 Tax=Cupriavidus metallidurans TaxID=119219 RepID=UPI001CCE769F|nr:hemolysin XhlA family protein [Cupriavidus metallidurans]UBM12782.1 hemolysin XhlA family protein [Cupriavidus metallidurans]
MTATTNDHDKQEKAFQPRPRSRPDPEFLDMVAKRVVEMQKTDKTAKAAKTPISPGVIFAAATGGIALIFSVMTWLSSSTQDKVDKGTGPITIQLTEMDKRLTGRLDAVDKRLERIETRTDKIDDRLSKIESRLDRADARFDTVDAKLDQLIKRR